MAVTGEEITREVIAVGRIAAVPTLLQVLCEITGMGFAAVAHVTEDSWTACAVLDNIQFGLCVGGQLDVNTTLCIESRAARAPIVIDHASDDPRYCNHHTPRLYKIESYVSVPIILNDGRYFGNLCAIDPRPAQVSDPRVLSMFVRFANLIAMQLQSDLDHQKDRSELLDERASGELREQFIAILGHDLRNPLQAFFAGCDVLARKVTDPTALHIVTRMRSHAQRMSAMINDVLDFARSKLGNDFGVRVAQVDGIDKALVSVVQEIRDANVGRSIEAAIDVHRPVCCDLGRVQQLASNLLANAISHGTAQVPIKFSAGIADHALIISVSNGGEPIAPEHLDKIFTPFWRSSTSAHRGGLGLGLHICEQIVRAHGGTIAVTSSHNEGTRFTASLPCLLDGQSHGTGG